MRRVVAIVAAGMLLVLTACTGLPTSGSVNPGNLPREADDAPAFNLVPDPPRAGSSPEQIVDGFLQAGVGAQDNWQTAREYLTPEYAPDWVPLKQVTIDRLAERSTSVATPTPSPAAGQQTAVEVTQRVTAEALVSSAGEYTPLEGGSQPLPFHLVQRDGEWRIDRAPDGIVLNQEVFASVFTAASLMYFDPDYSYLVPDVRWFPRNLVAARVTQALVDSPPTAWLEPAVVTAFPENVSLASNVVSLVDGGTTAQVELGPSAFTLEERTLNRMQTQLEESLESVGVANVQMMVGTTPLDAEAVPVRADRVDIRPVVETVDGEFGFLGVDGVEDIPGLSSAIEDTDAAAAVIAADRRTAAVLNRSGAVLRAYADESTNVLDGSTPGLLAPSVDTKGAVWTMAGNVPTSFVVYPLEGQAVTISPAWPLASRVFAFQISRDGTRMAALVRANERTEVWVSAITREDELPTAVGEPLVLATTPSLGIGIAWQDDVTLGVLLNSAQGPTVLVQPVGGRGALVAVPSGAAVDISGGNSSARLRTADGILLIQRGENWEEGAADIAVLAVQQGQPE